MILQKLQIVKQEAATGKASRNVGNYASAIVSAAGKIALFAGAILTLKRSLDSTIDTLSVASDFYTDIQKTTQLTTEETSNLVEELKKIDTRTTLQGLAGIATAAGRMKIAQKDIVGFVTTVDKAFLALGDSLQGTAEEIALDLAKISKVFGVQAEFGAAEGIERIGSVINELGQNTIATEGNILDFTKRLQGVAGIANISAADVAGLGATLEAFGQDSEKSASSVSKILVSIGKKEGLAKFAKLAGLSLKEFSKIAEEDANEALIKVLESAKSTAGGLVGLGQTLQSLGIKQQRAAAVATVLVNNIDELRENQELANKAFEENTSLAKEAALRNANLAAQIAKLKNEFINLVTDSRAIEFLKNVVIGFREVFNQAKNIGKTLVVATTAFVSYALAVKGVTIATKAWTIATNIAKRAQILFDIVMKSSPIGLIVAGITAAATAFLLFRDSTEDATESQKELNKELEKTKKLTEDTRGIEERAKITESLNKRQLEQLKQDALVQRRIFEDQKAEIDLLQKKRDEVSGEFGLPFLEQKGDIPTEERIAKLRERFDTDQLARLDEVIAKTDKYIKIRQDAEDALQKGQKGQVRALEDLLAIRESNLQKQTEGLENVEKLSKAENKRLSIYDKEQKLIAKREQAEAKRIEKLNARLQKEFEAEQQAAQKKLELDQKTADEADAILDDLLVTEKEKFEIAQLEKLLILQKRLRDGLISQTEYNEAVQALDQETADKHLTLSEQTTQQTAAFLTNTFTSLLSNLTDFTVSASKRLQNFWKGFASTAISYITKVALALAATKLLNFLAPGAGTLGSLFLKGLGGVANFATGGYTGRKKNRLIQVNDDSQNRQEFVTSGLATQYLGSDFLQRQNNIKSASDAEAFKANPGNISARPDFNNAGRFASGGSVSSSVSLDNSDVVSMLRDVISNNASGVAQITGSVNGITKMIEGLPPETIAVMNIKGKKGLAIRNVE